MEPVIVILNGPDAGLIVAVRPPRFTIGRAVDNDLCLKDPLASRHHYALEVEDGRLCLLDAQTPNGTIVDGIPRIKYAVNGGERVLCGGTAMLILLSRDSLESLPAILDDEADRSRNLTTLRVDYAAGDTESIDFRNATYVFRKMPAAANAIPDLNELLVRFLRSTFQLIPAHRGAILVNAPDASPDPDNVHSRICMDRDFKELISFPLSRKVLDQVYAGGKPYQSNDAPPIMCVPMVVFSRLLGVIYLEGTDLRGGFGSEHLEFLQTVADHASLAVRVSKQFRAMSNKIDLIQDARTFKFEMVGKSAAFKRLEQQIEKAAADPTASVLIIGETGTGKEGVARAIHRMSARRDKNLVTFNCANVFEPSLMQSEFFGHIKGAFTGASEPRKGKLLQANHGTLFLDEIGELPAELQQALLRVLQEREFEHVGGDKPIQIDVRLIAATNVELEDAISQGKFRADLYYRIKVVKIVIPPLRERRDDIPLLAEYFLHMYGQHRPNLSIAQEVMEALIPYDWPGNIRELQGVIHSAIVDADADVIRLENIPKEVREGPQLQSRMERILMLAASGKKAPEIARELGISHSYVSRVLRQKKQG